MARRPPPEKKPKLSPQALALVARRFRALSDPTRLSILQSLFEGEASVQELCEKSGARQANVSKHLSILADQGIVGRRKKGLFVHYRIVDDSIYDLCKTVCGALADRFENAVTQFGAARRSG